MRKSIALLTVLAAFIAALLTTALVPAVPARADPPEPDTLRTFFAHVNGEHELVVFWNIRRAELCDWVDSGFKGPPPVVEPVEVMDVATRQGAVVRRFSATRATEV